MASIKQIGNSYKIVVSNGYDVNGKRIREKITFQEFTERWLKEYANQQLEMSRYY